MGRVGKWIDGWGKRGIDRVKGKIIGDCGVEVGVVVSHVHYR